jgi:hypothetical protein
MVRQRLGADALEGLRRAGGMSPNRHEWLPTDLTRAIQDRDNRAENGEASSRSVLSLEALLSFVLAIVIAVVPMGFWVVIGLWTVLLSVSGTFLWRSPLTAQRTLRWKVILTVLLVVVAAPIGYKIADQKAREPEKVAEAIIKKLPVALATPSTSADQTETTPRPEINEVVVQVMDVGPLEYLSGIKRQGIKVSMLLDNNTVPDAELQDVSGEVWAESKYLVATIRKTPSDHPWEKDRDRLRYLISERVLPKMSHEWLPTLVFALPPAGERAIFGAEVGSQTTDFRQFRWWLANENGKGIVHGGDATPKMPGVVK